VNRAFGPLRLSFGGATSGQTMVQRLRGAMTEQPISDTWATVLDRLSEDDAITPMLQGFLNLVEPKGIAAGPLLDLCMRAAEQLLDTSEYITAVLGEGSVE
jgi:hypothetical protein